MPDLRDAYRLATDDVRPAPGALDRQRALQRRIETRRKAGAFVAIAAVLALIAVVILASDVIDGRQDDQPAIPAPPGLFSLDIETGALTPFHDPGEGTFNFELSPDGERLLMSWDHMQAGKRQIWIANADGTGAEVLVRTDGAMGTWFPDSRHIAYVGLPPDGDTRQVIVLDTVTGATTVVTDEERDPIDPTVSPDGSTIVYAFSRKEALGLPDSVSTGDEPGTILAETPPRSWLRAVDTAGSLQTRTLSKADDTIYWSPDVAPSGDIVWVSGRSQFIGYDDVSEIRVTGADGGDGHVIVAADGDAIIWVDCPAWSPDGSLLAYTREAADGVGVWVYDPVSGDHRQIGRGWLEGWLDDDTVLIGT